MSAGVGAREQRLRNYSSGVEGQRATGSGGAGERRDGDGGRAE